MLDTKPKFFRGTRTQGYEGNVSRHGGMNRAGIIKDVSVITRGEALGHDLWIDEAFLDAVVELGNRPNKGVKSRYTHPNLSGDGIGKHLGRVTNFYRVGDQVFGDLHLSEAAHDTPDGDLAGYVMTLAEEDPEAFGLSIAFAMGEADEDGYDERNVLELAHATLASLQAVDVVGDPAANPNGLFYRGDIPQEADAAVEYVLGLSDTRPAACFGIDPDRARGYFSRFLQSHNLEIQKGGDPMSDQTTTPDVEQVETPESIEAPEAVIEEEVEATEVETEAVEETVTVTAETGLCRDELKRFTEKFGAEAALQWYVMEQLSYEEALELYVEKLEGDLEASRVKSDAADFAGEETPIELTSEEDVEEPKSFAAKIAKSQVFQGR